MWLTVLPVGPPPSLEYKTVEYKTVEAFSRICDSQGQYKTVMGIVAWQSAQAVKHGGSLFSPSVHPCPSDIRRSRSPHFEYKTVKTPPSSNLRQSRPPPFEQKKVEARFWPWLSGTSPQNVSRQSAQAAKHGGSPLSPSVHPCPLNIRQSSPSNIRQSMPNSNLGSQGPAWSPGRALKLPSTAALSPPPRSTPALRT